MDDETPPVIAVTLNPPGQPEGAIGFHIDLGQVPSPEAMGALLFDLKMQAVNGMIGAGMADPASVLNRMFDGETARMNETMPMPDEGAKTMN